MKKLSFCIVLSAVLLLSAFTQNNIFLIQNSAANASLSSSSEALESVSTPKDDRKPVVMTDTAVINTHDYFSVPLEQDKDRYFYTYDEMKEFIKNIISQYPNKDLLIPQFEKYDEEWFKTQGLFYTAFSSGSGSLQVKINQLYVTKENFYLDYSTEMPEVGTCDMAYFCLFVGFDKSSLPEDAVGWKP